MNAARLPLVVFTPLPPERNGIADYSAELLAELARQHEIVAVVDDAAAPAPLPGVEILPLSAYRARRASLGRRPHLYQLGNNAGHVYLLPELLATPGVVVLHDVTLHHLADQATLRYGDHAAYAQWLALEHGPAGRLLAEQFQQRQWRGPSFFRDLPMTREILGRSRAVLVHSRYAAAKAAAQAPATPVVVVPHHVSPAAVAAGDTLRRSEVRAQLGVADDEVLLVSLGFVTRSKQIERVLRWLADARGRLPRVRYAIVGSADAGEFDLASAVQLHGLEDRVTLTGYVDEPGFFRWVAAADVVVNLRYPTGGETSGVLVRALGQGACVVVNDIGPFAEYPDETCVKVPATGPGADEAFARHLDALVLDPALRERKAAAARRHLRSTHAIARTAAIYGDTLARHAGHGGGAATGTTAYRTAGALRQRLAGTPGPWPAWVAEGWVPVADGPARVLAVGFGAGAVDRWLAVFGHAAASVDTLADTAAVARASFAPGGHACALVQLPLDADSARAAAWLAPLRQALRPQGRLIVTAPGGRRRDWVAALEQGGFDLVPPPQASRVPLAQPGAAAEVSISLLACRRGAVQGPRA